MNKWQRQIITENKTDLIRLTNCITTFIEKFTERRTLSQDEKEELETEKRSTARASKFYGFIVQKRKGFEILIEICRDPEFAQEAVADLLCEKTKEAGHGDFLSNVASDNGTSSSAVDAPSSSSSNPHKRKLIDETVSAGLSEKINSKAMKNEEEMIAQTNLPNELEKFVCEGKELTVNVVQPHPGVQVLTEKPKYLLRKDKNYALILNITEFYNKYERKATADMDSEYIEFDKKNERQGGEKDTEYMEDLLKGLGYTIFPEKKLLYGGKWTKKVIEEELERFYDNCNQHDVDSMVVFLGSHGREGHLMTSDGQWLDVHNEVIYRLQSKKTGNVQKPVAKIFIIESCQKAQNDRQIHHSTLSTPTPLPNCEDTILISAQMVKYEASRDIYCGSYFVMVLVFVLMTQSWITPLDKMLENSQELLKRMSQRLGVNSFQVNPFSIIGLKTPFYFFPR